MVEIWIFPVSLQQSQMSFAPPLDVTLAQPLEVQQYVYHDDLLPVITPRHVPYQ